MNKKRFLLVTFLAFGFLTSCNNVTSSNSTPISVVKQGDVCIDLEITQMPKKLTYKAGERFNPAGLKFNAIYQNGFQGDRNLDYGDLDGWTPAGALTSKDTKINLLFEGFHKEIDITIEEKLVKDVEITRQPDIKSYFVGDKLDLSGLMVKATYEEGIVENEKDYVIKDKDGNVYENGMVLENKNENLELFITISGQGVTKTASFIIGVYSGISLQAENVNDEIDLTNSAGYAERSGKHKVVTSSKASGTGYVESIDKGFEIKYYVYSHKSISNADLILTASSTRLGETSAHEDMQFNSCFKVYQGEEKTPISVADSTIVKGGGTTWIDWRDVNLGKVNLSEGYNLFTFECIGYVKDNKPTNAYDRVPNIDCLKVSKDNDVLVVEAESNKGSGLTLDDVKTSFTKVSATNIKNDCTFTGTGYIGSIQKGFKIDFYIYSDKEVENADLVLVASSTCQGDGRMVDMVFNQCFSATKDGVDLPINDEVVIPGLEYPPTGSGGNMWTNWADANFGKIKLNKGFTVVSLTCIGTIRDSSNNQRTPNIDRLDIRF